MQGEMENTEVRLFDLETGSSRTLLDDEKAKEYTVYKAFVAAMDWTAPGRLLVSMSDGDVGLSRVTFDVASRTILDQTHAEGEEAGLGPEEEEAVGRARELFPGIDEQELTGALFSSGSVADERGMLVDLGSQAGGIWVLDFGKRRRAPIARLPEEGVWSLCGGVILDDGVLFVAGDQKRACLVLHRNGALRTLHTMPSIQSSHLRLARRDGATALFMVRTHDTSAGRRVAFSHWEGSERHIAIGTLSGIPVPKP